MQNQQINLQSQTSQWKIASFDQPLDPPLNQDWQNINYEQGEKHFFQMDLQIQKNSLFDFNHTHLDQKQVQSYNQSQYITLKNKRQTFSTSNTYDAEIAIDDLLNLQSDKKACFEDFQSESIIQKIRGDRQIIKYNGQDVIQKKKYQKPLFKSQKLRMRMFINISNEIEKSYIKILNGTSDDTNRFQVNFRRINLKILQNLSSQKILDKNGEQLYIQYKNSPSQGFFETRRLFGINQKSNMIIDKKADCLRKQINKFYSSSNFIKEIMKSKILLKTKLLMVKFGSVFNNTVRQPQKHHKWKKQRS